ncbi:Anucleate primary sterigmata protein B-like protein [Emericellopsis cladophorae]|uniref:Anucleate primary sterigmata protein B-like protein n=1 Tax=Emericellopsis cladophorae TaxID=2686198 RepID=A0A9P9XV82_9HYPO|nr:Anucleate primary sterigmata protein B-like protein [Emericellopsis cladophorae]KAI6778434.1 Anucleate primary sterigmata protein B-like protein [Emericellopsis cladophorae]
MATDPELPAVDQPQTPQRDATDQQNISHAEISTMSEQTTTRPSDQDTTPNDRVDPETLRDAAPDEEPESLVAGIGMDSSSFESFEAAPMDPSRGPDESLTEEAVREHLNDIESSFLPRLSPIPTGANAFDGGVDDTYIFDSPNKAAMQMHQRQPPPHEGDSTATAPENTTASLEAFDSSPTAAAVARTMSRAASTARHGDEPTISTKEDNQTDETVEDGSKEPQESSQVSSVGDQEGSLSRAQSLNERVDAGSTPGNALRTQKRPKYLRSRHGSQRSSTSSFAASETHEGSDVTAMGYSADYALQSGGAIPALATPSRNALSRTISMGSVASGFEDYTDPSLGHLETLPEVNSPDRSQKEDLAQTPKPSQENFETAPTDTVIARHVRNVHVPESLAKEYKYKSGLETPRRPANLNMAASVTTTGRTGGRSLTLKEQSSTIERLSKENFDLKLKVMFLSDRLDKLSEEGIKEMISENVELKTSLAVLQRDNRILRRRIKELEKQEKDNEERPSTAKSGASSTDQTAKLYDEDAQEREEELYFLRERVEEYATEIERLRTETTNAMDEKRRMTDVFKTMGDRVADDNVGRQEEADVWKDLLEQETARREQADDDNRKLRDEVFRLKQEISGYGGLHHTTNIYNITKKQRNREQGGSGSRPVSGLSGDFEGSNANFSAGSTLVDELRKETEHLRHENAELRREVGAQTSMLTSRNREKERLYQEIEDLKMAARHGRQAPSTIDSLLDRSASRVGGHERPQSRGSGMTRRTSVEEDMEQERDALEAKLAESRDKLSEVKLQNQELQRELETCMEDFEAAVNGKRESEEAAVQLQEDLENAMNDLIALQSERDEALREQAAMEEEFEALRVEAQEEIDALELEADQRSEELQRMQTELTDRSENFDALQEEMRKMSDALIGLEDEQENKLRRIEQLELELDSSNKELEEFERKLMEANEKNQRLSVQQESSQDEIGFLREEQETDKIRIGDLEASLAGLEHSLREEKDRARELDNRLSQEREQREIVANKEKEDVQQIVNQLNKEASTAKDEVRRLRKSLSSREIEATEWKERLIELENNLGEALGDLNGTRSSFLKSITKIQRELEDTIRELDSTRASVVEKDRLIKQRDALLESHALESRKLSELLDKERVSHRNTKAQHETFQRNHQLLARTNSTQDTRISELESTRGQDRARLLKLEQQSREQLAERNQLLLTLWQKLSALCGREWANSNTLIDRQVLPSLEVIATRLPGFSKNLLAAVKTIETIVGSFQLKIKTVERDLTREYQNLESNLDVRSKKLDRLETMVRNTAASSSTSSSELHSRLLRLEDKYRQLKVENATLKAANDARARSAYTGLNPEALIPGDPGSPSPSVPRGPMEKDRTLRPSHGSSRTLSRTHTAPSTGNEIARRDPSVSDEPQNDNRWLFRLREMEHKLKQEREARNQDRQAARARLGGLENENRDLRERVRRGEE